MKENKPDQKAYISYLKYSGMAIQMGVVIYLCSLLGQYLDQRFQSEKSLYSVFFILFGILSSLFLIVKNVISESKNE